MTIENTLSFQYLLAQEEELRVEMVTYLPRHTAWKDRPVRLHSRPQSSTWEWEARISLSTSLTKCWENTLNTQFIAIAVLSIISSTFLGLGSLLINLPFPGTQPVSYHFPSLSSWFGEPEGMALGTSY